MVILVAIHYNVQNNGVVMKKAAYVAIVTDLEWEKMYWESDSEQINSKILAVGFERLENRGVGDVLIVCVGGVTGFVEAINIAFPKTEMPPLHHPSNPLFQPICFLQGHQAIYGCQILFTTRRLKTHSCRFGRI